MVNSLDYGIAPFDELPRIVEIKMVMFYEADHADLLVVTLMLSIRYRYSDLWNRIPGPTRLF